MDYDELVSTIIVIVASVAIGYAVGFTLGTRGMTNWMIENYHCVEVE